MSSSGNIKVRLGRSVGASMSGLLMAWARDVSTGEPRYILELDQAHRGAKCGCECPSCGAALTAVNAAKDEFEVRPHFRHPAGTQRDECLVLVARAALLRQFEEGGWLELPRRRVSATVTGLSGSAYDAWVEQAAEKLHISKVTYRDRTQAIITFDDGRELLVVLTGLSSNAAGHSGEDGHQRPTIVLDVDDPSLASLDPHELRRRLRLLPSAICWRHHWHDGTLEDEANREALRSAQFQLDAAPDGVELPQDLPPELKRESVLHYEVKRILATEGRLRCPALTVEVSVPRPDGASVDLRWSEDSEVLCVDHVDLERRLGRIVPDITCKAWPEDGGRVLYPLLIEVAVSHLVDDAKLEDIRSSSEAALEIDFSRTGGRVNLTQLRHLVVEEVSLKRWLHNPFLDEQRVRLLAEANAVVEREAEGHRLHELARDERKRAALAIPLEELGQQFLVAITGLYDIRGLASSDRLSDDDKRTELIAEERVSDLADRFAMRGFPEASDGELIGHTGILSHLLSCKLDRPVGYRVANVAGVLNAVWQKQSWRRGFHSLVFIAMAVYRPKLKLNQQLRVEGWREQVRESIRADESTYLRDPIYDQLLSLLFPEMAEALAQPRGKLQGLSAKPYRNSSRRAYFIEYQPRADQAVGPLTDTAPGQWWLRGRDLQAWQASRDLAASRFDVLLRG